MCQSVMEEELAMFENTLACTTTTADMISTLFLFCRTYVCTHVADDLMSMMMKI